jgi:hypothetical protein
VSNTKVLQLILIFFILHYFISDGEIVPVFMKTCQLLLIEGATWLRDGSLRPYSLISRPEPLLFLPSSSSVVLTRLSGPRSGTTTSQEIW